MIARQVVLEMIRFSWTTARTTVAGYPTIKLIIPATDHPLEGRRRVLGHAYSGTDSRSPSRNVTPPEPSRLRVDQIISSNAFMGGVDRSQLSG